MARISLLSEENASPEARQLFEKMEQKGARILNLYRVLAHNPTLTRDFLKLGNSLLSKTALPAKLRELAILRIAMLTGSKYEWAQHHSIALEAGVSRQQIGAIPNWSYSTNFDEQERAVLRYTDEIIQRTEVSNETFDRVKKHLDEQGILEITLAIGYWGMVARLLVPLQVEVDEETAGSAQELAGRKYQKSQTPNKQA